MGEEGFKQKRLEWEFVRDVIDSFLEWGNKEGARLSVNTYLISA